LETNVNDIKTMNKKNVLTKSKTSVRLICFVLRMKEKITAFPKLNVFEYPKLLIQIEKLGIKKCMILFQSINFIV